MIKLFKYMLAVSNFFFKYHIKYSLFLLTDFSLSVTGKLNHSCKNLQREVLPFWESTDVDVPSVSLGSLKVWFLKQLFNMQR